nr:hypothetical protein [Microbacterium azadirachtae]
MQHERHALGGGEALVHQGQCGADGLGLLRRLQGIRCAHIRLDDRPRSVVVERDLSP